jgi:hypothetical protein
MRSTFKPESRVCTPTIVIDQEYSMKICKRLLCGSLTLFGLLFTGTSNGQQPGDGYFQPAGVQPMMADVNVGWPGRVWVQGSLADQGLGYNGSYFTLGAKTHVSEDFLDGRWMVEARGHYDPENEGFFGNIGLERVFSLPSAGADVSSSVWADYDSDLQGTFSHAMKAFGVSGSIKTHRWALIGNGYLPFGTTDYAEGDPTGVNCFLNHSIVTQAGIDSALKGFDVLLQVKPDAVAHVNGSFGIGGYGYSSALVESFGGVRARVGMQFNQGMIVNAEINHDNRFDITGVVQLGWLFGAGARGTEYGYLGTDLEPTIRNDHIVRFQQDLRVAFDPDTGRPYNVYHVDNTADPGFADGRGATPFTTLAAAEAAASADDIIFVREGDGTTRNMENGIVLKDGQMLLGDGVRHIIPLLGGTNFVLCNDIDGNLPTITNVAGNAVTLANRNTVRGIIIDGSQGGMLNGIFGQGTLADPLTTGIIEDVTITGTPVVNGPILNGISLRNVAGDWQFARNNIQLAFLDGILIDNALDPTSTFTFRDNVVSNNDGHGIHMLDYDGTEFNFVNNTTSNNVGNGVFLENYTNSLGTGGTLDFINPVANANQDNGIAVDNFTGNVRFLNSDITNNLNGGISLVDVVTPDPLDMVFVGTSGGGVSNFTGNGVGTGAGIFNQLNVAGAREHLVITNSTISNGGMGISSSATAVGANLQTDIIDNIDISGNQSDGIRLMSSGGATHTAQVINTAPAGILQINNNQGNGISQFASGIGPISLLETDIQNVNIGGSGDHGMLFNTTGDGQIISRTLNATITGSGQDGVQINADNLNNIAVNEFRFENTTITNVGDDGFDLNIGDQTFADFSLVNSVLNNNFTGNHGMEINATGDAALTIDTRLRLNVVGTTINAFDSGDGIDITSAGDAHVFAQIEANVITNNGINQVAAGQPAVPFADGINILAGGDSEIFTRILNNRITLNAEQGLDIQTVGNGQVTALVSGNFLANNDTQDDIATVPVESGNQDMTATNGVTGQICISMSTNFFNLPVLFVNNSGAGAFTLELDGLTNGLGVPTLVGPFTILPFGSTCSPAIDAEDLAFRLDGFTPLP